VVNANSFWVDGHFEETNLAPIRVGDPAQIKLVGCSQVLRGHVDGIAHAINVSNAQPNDQGVATVNPILTWVRLAQRIPVRVYVDHVPPDVVLEAGMTVTAQAGVDRRFAASSGQPEQIHPSIDHGGTSYEGRNTYVPFERNHHEDADVRSRRRGCVGRHRHSHQRRRSQL
jgi:hypothetical protein